jgi:hypothetical protein
MPNAKDSHVNAKPKILILGSTGSGKTSQFCTLPGKKFIYCFDPNALLTLQGQDVDYEQFMPDVPSIAISSLKKGTGDRSSSAKKTSEAYLDFEKDFETRIRDGFFTDYDYIAFDSCTTLLDMIMDRVLTINGRAGQWPQQDDYGPQMNTFTNIVRTAMSLGIGIYFTGHLELQQDQLSKRIYQTPILTGKLKAKIPLLFSEILAFDAQADNKGNVNYRAQTKPSSTTPLIRCTVRDLQQFEDITLDYTKSLVGQGLGRILK